MKIYIYLLINFFYFMMNIIFFLDINNHQIHYISKINSLCYSWISSNKYEIRYGLCNINCSYIRHIPFPNNKPFQCNINNYQNRIKYYNIKKVKYYYFNTSTYGKYIKEYRYLYNNVSVYNMIYNRIII